MQISKQNLINTLAYIIAAIFIFNCRSILGDAFSVGNIPNFVLWVATLLWVLIIYSSLSKKQFTKLWYCSVIWIVYIGLFLIFTSKKMNTISLGISIFLFIWLVGTDYKNDNIPVILDKYAKLMYIIAGISLIFWILGSILHIIHPTGIVFTGWTGNNRIVAVPSYYNLYFETQTNAITMFNGISRNSAIFLEAPMAALNFSIALLINIYESRYKNNKFSRVVLIIAILSTLSMTAYIFLLILFGIKTFYSKNNFLGKYRVFILPVIIIIIGILGYIMLREKFTNNIASAGVRANDYTVGFRAWMSHPIIGIGISNYDDLKNYMDLWRANNTGFSNSIMDVLSGGGLYLTVMYLFAYIRGFIVSKKAHNTYRIVFVVMMFYLFITTFFTYTYILLFILCWFALESLPKSIGE
ncbi:O-antigen ligase family protein [Lactobacillus sp. LL6]|uniref:O-antigen ligase family protein n=1 Tax=Lactobacillus sp. LL6 TaxID=2596827 RepID=UPI001186C6E4|nr:O-antigen ligase family protein [Lactobacillus sp. LL6]TSO25683.1 hypothetical protein FOD82_00985 [Lactobacillus sp. LL6]